VGVILSLVYLSIQIRQNTRSARASTFQAIAFDAAQFNSFVVSDPETTRVFLAGGRGDKLSEEDYFRFQQFLRTFFRFHDTLYFQFVQGMIGEDQWRGYFLTLERIIRLPGIQKYWRHNRETHSRGFRALVEEALDSPETSKPGVAKETSAA
jgi:hypothetical protein